MKKILILVAVIATMNSASASANDLVNLYNGGKKWFKTEVIPVIIDPSKLEIKPYIAITHDGQSIKVGPKEAHIQVLGFSASTHNLTQRLAEAECIVGSGGAASVICANAVIPQLLGQMGIPAGAIGGTPPPTNPSEIKTESNQCQTESIFCITPDKRPLGLDCGCYDEKGAILTGIIK